MVALMAMRQACVRRVSFYVATNVWMHKVMSPIAALAGTFVQVNKFVPMADARLSRVMPPQIVPKVRIAIQTSVDVCQVVMSPAIAVITPPVTSAAINVNVRADIINAPPVVCRTMPSPVVATGAVPVKEQAMPPRVAKPAPTLLSVLRVVTTDSSCVTADAPWQRVQHPVAPAARCVPAHLEAQRFATLAPAVCCATKAKPYVLRLRVKTVWTPPVTSITAACAAESVVTDKFAKAVTASTRPTAMRIIRRVVLG